MRKFEIYCNFDFLLELYKFINEPIKDLLTDKVNDNYYGYRQTVLFIRYFVTG